MMPSNLKYPEFVPDQLLTSENLNDLFTYLDEQGRMTRTNLLGVGIVCGFEVKTAADGTSIVLTKGTGVTSEGYLVAQEERTYTQHIPFDPAKEIHYGKFLTAANLKKFDMWELKQTAASEGTTPLTLNFLNGGGVNDNKKVVLLFVELLQEQNKNCNPESCDDKGITIRVNLRPLLVRKQDADSFNLTSGIGPIYYNNNFATLNEMRMQRFDVTSTPIVTAAGLFTAYKKIITPNFLKSIEHLLSTAWAHFKAVIGTEFQQTNPFAQLAEKFAFVNNGSISPVQLRNLQYAYSHLADLLAAYEEFRRTGMEILSTCCPDAVLFPRHLLLDLAIKDVNVLHSSYRHHFRYSPLFQKKDLHGRLRSLFRRLALMTANFKVPDPVGTKDNPDGTIRITPSRLDPSPLSDKAIPYYYEVSKPTADPLYRHWSYEKTQATDAGDNLSYHAGEYATKDFIAQPLQYDLEPYNFLRVEGHLGKAFPHVLQNLKRLIKDNRLPIDVVGLSLGADASDTELVDPKVLQDIQVQYEVLKAEVICCLKRQAKYFGKLAIKDNFKYGKLHLNTNLFQLFTGGNFGMFAAAAGEAATGGAMERLVAAGASKKGDLIANIIGTQEENFLIKDYLKYQEKGDFNLSRIPAPAAALDDQVISHFALQIIDEIGELLVLLEAENPLTLDVDGVTQHGKVLEKILDTLLERVEKEMVIKRPYLKVKAYVGEAQHVKVDAIADAMPDLGEENANTLVLLMLNLPEGEKTTLVNQLRAQKGSRTQQVAILNYFFGRLDKDGMMVPPTKDIAVVEDAFLRELRDRLKTFNCLCTLQGFAKLRDLLRKIIIELKQANLFSVFAAKHPGIQHKAGVTMGGTFIVVYHRKGGKAAEQADPIYEKVAAEFPDGVVVADFYLPYLSYSSHPPIVFQVNDAEAVPEEVVLGLQPSPVTGALRYNVADETPYSFSHVPNNGTLTNGTAANGVTALGADNFVFTPSKTKALLGNNLKADLAFKYVKKGVASPDVKVTVFNIPTAEIKQTGEKPEVPPGTPLNIKASTAHADKFSWLMQDATGKSEEIAVSKDLANFNLAKEGTFSFTLRTTQSETGAQAISNTVKVEVRKNPEAPVKTCGSLLLVLADYEKLPGIDPNRFNQFDATVLDKWGIKPYFDKLKNFATLSDAEQNEFFKSKMPDGSTQSAILAGWMEELAGLAGGSQNERNRTMRLLALETYRILAELVLYMSCLRKEDLGKAEEQIFANMIVQLKGRGRVKGLLGLPEMTDAEKSVLSHLQKDFEAEVKRQAANNRINPKPKYARALKAVQAVF